MRTFFRPAGDSALVMYFQDAPPDECSRHVRRVLEALDESCPAGVTDLIPARTSLLLTYNPLASSREQLEDEFSRLTYGSPGAEEGTLHEIPVLYGGAGGADLSGVAAEAGLSEEEVVRLHSSEEYTVYFLGFMPGFPYMGPLPEALRSPRLETPRTLVPAGSVAVAEDQTGIYPVASPGGWRLLGRTPLQLFDPRQDPPSLLQPGDRVRFLPVDEAEYSRLHFQVLKGG